MIERLKSLLGGGRRSGGGNGAPDATPLAALSAMTRALPDPCLLLDARGHVRAFNEGAREILGHGRLNQPVAFALRAPEVIEAVKEVTVTGRPVAVRYYERVPTDRWFEAHVAPIHIAATEPDAPGAILVVLHDLTQARRLERMRADFVANASHELRTPLAALSGFIETLQGPARNDVGARDRFLGIMHSQANRMSRLIDDLLSLSRIELAAHVRPDSVVDLRDIVGHVVDGLSQIAAENGVTLALSAPEPIPVRGDRDELIRLCENLIENAIKYGASGRKVEITAGLRAGEGGGEAFLSVRDFGPGIPPEHLPRLTERFYRVDAAESREKGGTGLGLAIVKHILARHRGKLEIESPRNEGATFTARLAAVPPE